MESETEDKNLSLAFLTSRLIQIMTKSLYSPTEKFTKYMTFIKDNRAKRFFLRIA